ncbi:MAG TPA: hypothetical protein VGO25_01515 [Rhodanobacteraceae bacterium]|jgi:hypothetical protein|nr:hypothetical protein [Rhodanobacteraceae bacterium]
MKATKLLLAAALVAGTAFAQQNVDISGKDFESGAGDARFASIGRQAAASGKRIVVTAPQQWHGKIAAKIRAGGAADVVLKDGFYENVLVRVEEKPAEPPKPEPKVEARAEPKPAPKSIARVPDEVPGPKPTLPPPVAAAEPAPIVAPPRAPVAAPTPKPVASPPPATAVATRAPAVAAPAKPDIAGIQKRLETSLNSGRVAEGPISASALQPGDFIFVDGPVRAVVRRESLRPRMFWLEGELELRRTELKELASNKYQVIDPVRGDIFSLREERADQAKTLVATEPPDNSPVRATFERDYNDGHPIAAGIAIEKLRSGDIVYVGKGMAVVVRREGQSLSRYWLEGTLDLGQSGLQKDGANKYKVVSDTLR